jgi:hypothetical protein
MNYKDMTEEEITYQLEWSDENEFGTNYAKFLREENKQLKKDKKKAIEYIKEHILPYCDESLQADFIKILEILGDKE